MSRRTLVLGGGFGGIAASVELKRLLGDDHEVVLVDRKPAFTMGLRKLWELVGHGTIAEGSRNRSLLDRHGIRVVQEEILSIDPASRSAETSGGRLEGDHLVIALGAVSRPDLVPGLTEHGNDVWGFAGVPAAAEALARFDGGRLLILIAGAPYPCPPAPYECAFHLDEHLRPRGLRDRTELAVVTLQPMLMPNAGWAGSEWMAGQLAERGISQRIGAKAERVEAGRVVLADGGEEPFDLLIAVPPHRPPQSSATAGSTAGSRLDRRRSGHARDRPRGRLRGRRREPDPALERIAAPEGRRDGRAAGTPRRPRDRGRAPGRRAAGPVRRQRLLPGRDRRRLRRPRRRELVRRARARRHDRRAEQLYAAEKAAFETEHLQRWFGS